MDGDLTREQLLALDPTKVLTEGLRRGPSPDETGLAPELTAIGALAFSEQLRWAGASSSVLERCLLALVQIWTRSTEGERLTLDLRQLLDEAVALNTAGFPVLRTWMVEICHHVGDRADLAAAVRFLERTHHCWQINDQLRGIDPPLRQAPAL
jgi:hypothetical protein